MKQNSNWFKRWLLGIATLFIGTGMLLAQEVTISGKITSSDDGQPLPGVAVVQKGTGNGTVSDFDGNYSLNVPKGSVVVFSFIGMKTQELTVGATTVNNVAMVSETTDIGEVMVTALGIKREKKALGYAVTEIKGDQLTSNVINPVNALQGKVAGLEISQSDGGMFGSSKILIRGVSTLGKNNQPIYVVDGVILDNAVSNSGSADWNQAADDYGNELKNLNPDDFESVSVLKGAAATALYGSRGMNGAIVITTKSGKARKGMGVEVSQTFGIDYVYKQPDLQNVYGPGALSGYVDYGQQNPDGTYKAYDNQNQFMLNSAGKPTVIGDWNFGYGPKFDGSQIEYFDKTTRKYSPVKNNFKDAYDLGMNTNTNVAISGGNETTKYYSSIGYLYSKGTLPNNDFQRLSLMTKASQDIGKFVNIEASLSFANSMPRNAQPNIGENFIDGTWDRMYDPKALKDKYKGTHGGLASSAYGDEYGYVPGRGVWWSINENNNTRKETSVRPGLIVKAHLTNWLDFTTEGNYNYYYVKSETKNLGSGYANEGGYYGMSQYTKEQTNLNAAFTVNKSFEDFTLNGFVRGEYYNNIQQYSGMWTNGGLIVPGQYFIRNSKDNVGYDGYVSGEKRMYSIASQISASWRDQIFVDVTGRNDWSSSLVYSDGHGTFSYFYPSVSGSWLASNTLDLPSWVSFAKIRGSWAQVGNDTDPYVINTAYSLGSSSTAGGKVFSLSLPNTVYYSNLKPERKNAVEMGLDLRFFQSRVNVDLALYKENTYNQIMSIRVPWVSGITNQLVNAGNIQNKGLELAINTIPYRTKDWEWSLDFTYTKNINKIVSLHENVADYIALDGDITYGNYRIGSVAKVGESYGILMSDSKPAIDKATGLPVLTWQDARRTAYIARSGKAEKVGSLVPDFLGSVATGVKYKNWSLRAAFDMRFGGYVASYGSRYGTAYGFTESSLKYSSPSRGGATWKSNYDNMSYSDGVIPDGIFPAGTKITQPDKSVYVVAAGGETFKSLYSKGVVEPVHASSWHYRVNSWGQGVVNDSWVKELDYIALREVTLNYRLSQNVANRLGVGHVNFALSGRNLGYLLNTMPNGENPESVRGTSASEFRVRSFNGYTANYMFTVNVGF